MFILGIWLDSVLAIFLSKMSSALAGFSDKVFDIMKMMEEDKKALYNRINQIQL
jgi:hypothetical protein